jgi:hypothetical protein
VGGTSFLLHVRHAAAAITAGLAQTVLITHGESGARATARPGTSPIPPGSSSSTRCRTACTSPTRCSPSPPCGS